MVQMAQLAEIWTANSKVTNPCLGGYALCGQKMPSSSISSKVVASYLQRMAKYWLSHPGVWLG